MRTSSMPRNSANSSNHRYLKYPLLSFKDFDFIGSSAPRNKIRCPVPLRMISSGDLRSVNSSVTSRASMAHTSCSYIESLMVLPTRRNATAFAFSSSRRPRMISSEMNEDFVLALPPLNQYSACFIFTMSRCTGMNTSAIFSNNAPSTFRVAGSATSALLAASYRFSSSLPAFRRSLREASRPNWSFSSPRRTAEKKRSTSSAEATRLSS